MPSSNTLPVAAGAAILVGCVLTKIILDSISPPIEGFENYGRSGSSLVLPFLPLIVMFAGARLRFDDLYRSGRVSG